MTSVVITGLVLTLVGCWHLPKKTALEDIHDNYRLEFSKLFFSATKEGQSPSCVPGKNDEQFFFAETREKMRDFRVQYGTEGAESHHLTVLEGMMHLQVGNVGTAKLFQENIDNAKVKLLSRTGQHNRDFLFADNFADLVGGWTIVCKFAAAGNTVSNASPENIDFLEQAARNIAKRLNSDSKANKLSEPAVDQGAVYLATSAAIFHVWAAKARFDRCVIGEICECSSDPDDNCGGAVAVALSNTECQNEDDRTSCEQKIRTKFANSKIRPPLYREGRELIGLFLDDTERMIADCGVSAATSAARKRYVDWYAFLGKEIKTVGGEVKLFACPANSQHSVSTPPLA
jgi:hypothetical protein